MAGTEGRSSGSPPCVVVGAGPAGLMAAEVMARAGRRVVVYDSSPSPARKFLLAGRGGLNLTHSEAVETFLTRYGAAAASGDRGFSAASFARLGGGAWRRGLHRHKRSGVSQELQVDSPPASLA